MSLAALKQNIKSQWEGEGRKILSTSFQSLGARALGAVSQFFLTMALAQRLGAEAMGVYVLALSLMTMVSVMGRAGMDMSLLKYISSLDVEFQGEILRKGWWRMIGFSLGMTGLIVALSFFLAPPLANDVFKKPELLEPFRWMLMAVVPFSLIQLFSESLRALHKVGSASFLQAGLLPLMTLILFICLFEWRPSLWSAMGAFLGSVVVVMIAGGYLWWKALKEIVSQAQANPSSPDLPAVPSWGDVIRGSQSFAWVAITSMLMGVADSIILGLFKESSQVGVYSACYRFSILINFVLVAVSGILGPRFSRLREDENYALMEQVAQKGTQLMLVLALPALLLFFVAPDFLLSLFGKEFVEGAMVLRILAFGQLVNVAMGASGLMLMMTGHVQKMKWLNTLSLSVHLSLGFFLVPHWGSMGAALGQSVGLILTKTIAFALVIRHLGISTFPFFRLREKA